MSDQRAQDLIDLGNRLFTKKGPLDSLRQEISETFYPERATFTRDEYLGRDYTRNTMDSYPILVRRELGDSVSATLRPRDQKWFAATTLDKERDAIPENAQFLEYITNVMRANMYDARAKFVRATKEGDHDFVTFGECVISSEEAPSRDHLYYRGFHLRDCAWLENEIGDVDHLHRKDAMSARNMIRRFGEAKVSQSVKDAAKKEPGKEIPMRVVMMPADEYDYTGQGAKKGGKRLPYVIVYIDADNGKILDERPAVDFLYTVPRWKTISGSQYAFSPATVIGLPDGRMAQDMARILLESGEKAIDPPTIAKEEFVREANIAAGAITWIDSQFDGRVNEAFAPLQLNPDMRTGFAMRSELRDMLAKAFFIDKLRLPEATDQMTATEIRARLEEHVRNLLPLFEPMEHEYNNRILDKTFALLRNMGKINFEMMPASLSNTDLAWGFRNPMQEASERILASQYQEAMGLVVSGREAGLVSASPVNFDVALRDGVRGIGVPAKWQRTEEEIEAELAEKAKEAALAKAAQEAAAMVQLGQQAGDAEQSIQIAQAMQPMPAEGAANDDAIEMELPDEEWLGEDEPEDLEDDEAAA